MRQKTEKQQIKLMKPKVDSLIRSIQMTVLGLLRKKDSTQITKIRNERRDGYFYGS